MNEEEYKRRIKYLEEQLELEKSNSKSNQERYYKAENFLQLFGGYQGLTIPFDKEMKEEIANHIKKIIYNLIREDIDLQELFIKTAMNYKDAFIRIFKPIVKDLIEDLDFNVSFQTYKE